MLTPPRPADGVTAPALHHRLRDKEELLGALAELGFAQLELLPQAIAERMKGPDRQRGFRRIVRAPGPGVWSGDLVVILSRRSAAKDLRLRSAQFEVLRRLRGSG